MHINIVNQPPNKLAGVHPRQDLRASVVVPDCSDFHSGKLAGEFDNNYNCYTLYCYKCKHSHMVQLHSLMW